MTAGGTRLSCPTCPGYTGGGTTTGGSGGTEWCFYSNAKRNGSALGYSIACPKGSTGDCHKYTHKGESEAAAGLVLNESSQCWWEGRSGGTGGGGTGGENGTGGGKSSMQMCIYHNAEWKLNNNLNKTPGRIGRDVHCRTDYEGCDVMPVAAGTLRTLPVDTPQGQGIPAPRVDVSLGAPFCCAEGWSNKCEGASMNCRDSDAYYQCLGSRATPSNSELARSCEQKYCWFRDGGKGGKGGTEGEGEICRRGCEQKMQDCQRQSSIAFSPMWCSQTLAECTAQCFGDGGTGKKECGPSPGFFNKSVKNLRCVDGQWAWDDDGNKEEDFCKKFPGKCRKPEPGICEKELATYEATLGALDEQIKRLRSSFVDAKDAVTKKKDTIRALKKSKASRAEMSAAEQELKTLKRTVSSIVSEGKKLVQERGFTKSKYNRLQYECYPKVY